LCSESIIKFCVNAGFCELRSNGGNKIAGDSGFDQRILTAPVKSAVDKYQLLPEFLKVSLQLHVIRECSYWWLIFDDLFTLWHLVG